MLKQAVLLGTLSLVFAWQATRASMPMQQGQQAACYHKELDDWAFLEGDWTVRTNTRLSANGPWEQATASAQIKRDLQGCLLTERFNGTRQGRPFQALSLFAWNSNSQRLQQVFSDSEHGPLVFYEGAKNHAEILVDLDWKLPDGRSVKLRRAYFNFTKDSFTLESRRSTDCGKTWDTTGRAEYQRNTAAKTSAGKTLKP